MLTVIDHSTQHTEIFKSYRLTGRVEVFRLDGYSGTYFGEGRVKDVLHKCLIQVPDMFISEFTVMKTGQPYNETFTFTMDARIRKDKLYDVIRDINELGRFKGLFEEELVFELTMQMDLV